MKVRELVDKLLELSADNPLLEDYHIIVEGSSLNEVFVDDKRDEVVFFPEPPQEPRGERDDPQDDFEDEMPF